MRNTVFSREPIRGIKNLTVQWGAQFSPWANSRTLYIELSKEKHKFPSERLWVLNCPMRRTFPVSQSEVFKRWTVQWGAQFPNSYCTNVQYVFWENIEPIFYTFYLKTEHIHIVQIIVTVHYSIIYELEQNMYSKAYCEIL